MVLLNKRKGQAAIEFLMTYGWMLLVVLIVGALIFSFVDFGSLLPNKLDLSNNVRGLAADSVAYSADTANGNEANDVLVVFVYNGAKQAEIHPDAGEILTNLNKKCLSYNVTNVDTGASAGNTSLNKGSSTTPTTGVSFLNGQTGILRLTCNSNPTIGHPNTATVALIKGDVIEGQVTIDVKNPKTGLSVPSSGPIRLSIVQ